MAAGGGILPGMPVAKGQGRHGLGAIATEDLAEGAVVIPQWLEIAEPLEGWAHVDRREVRRLAPRARAFFLDYMMDLDFDLLIGPLSPGAVMTPDCFVNHSCAPNLRFDRRDNVVAARRIRRGEEVVIDYGFFNVNFDLEFACACGSAQCRGRVGRRDWQDLAQVYGLDMPRFLHGRLARLLGNRRVG